MNGSPANPERRQRGGAKHGCLVGAAATLLLLLGVATLIGVALFQNRSATVETRRHEHSIPGAAGAAGSIEDVAAKTDVSPDAEPRHADAAAPPPPPGRVELAILVGQAYVVPAPPGSPIRIEADYDPRRYELRQETSGDAESGWTYRVVLQPKGFAHWALFRAKLGAPPPVIRIALPRDVPLDLVGRLNGGILVLESGGLWLRSLDLEVSGGAAELSFYEPLREPMDSIHVRGRTGAIEVTHLGNASPRTAVFEQRLGAVDLDLRGVWSRDADIRVEGRLAGGKLWLPDNVEVEGLEGYGRRGPASPASSELPRPKLRFTLSARVGNMVVID